MCVHSTKGRALQSFAPLTHDRGVGRVRGLYQGGKGLETTMIYSLKFSIKLEITVCEHWGTKKILPAFLLAWNGQVLFHLLLQPPAGG